MPVAISPYSQYSVYGASYLGRAQGVQQPSPMLTVRRAAQPELPVQPVDAVKPVSAGSSDPAQAALLRYSSDPAAMAVRLRIQYPGGSAAQGVDAARQGQTLKLSESKSAQEVMEEGECQTCKRRKYQDGSDDPGVSFKTPTNIAPEQAAAAVRGHENEHVVREQAKAAREDRKVVSQSVTLHTDICPECGKVYISGGTTRTVTAADSDPLAQQPQGEEDNSALPAAVA